MGNCTKFGERLVSGGSRRHLLALRRRRVPRGRGDGRGYWFAGSDLVVAHNTVAGRSRTERVAARATRSSSRRRTGRRRVLASTSIGNGNARFADVLVGRCYKAPGAIASTVCMRARTVVVLTQPAQGATPTVRGTRARRRAPRAGRDGRKERSTGPTSREARSRERWSRALRSNCLRTLSHRIGLALLEWGNIGIREYSRGHLVLPHLQCDVRRCRDRRRRHRRPSTRGRSTPAFARLRVPQGPRPRRVPPRPSPDRHPVRREGEAGCLKHGRSNERCVVRTACDHRTTAAPTPLRCISPASAFDTNGGARPSASCA